MSSKLSTDGIEANKACLKPVSISEVHESVEFNPLKTHSEAAFYMFACKHSAYIYISTYERYG
jgi:hypothetical protein